MNNIENIQEYIPTVYVNDSEPDLDETNLNKTEQAIKRVTDAANKAIDALKQLDREKLALSAISNVLSDATDKVPSLALANTMQLAINDLNSNLGDVIAQSTYKTSLRSPAKTHTLGIHDNGTAYLDNDKVITNADLQSGIVTILKVPVGENEYDFNFTDIFTSAPKAIIATIQKRGYSDKLLLQANIKSAAQFTLSVYNGTASAINNISVYWIAK